MSLTLYGIKNCDTVKKARAWLTAEGREVAFHDYKLAGIDEATLAGWVKAHGWETVLNRAGTTFRALPEEEKQDLDAEKAIRLMRANPSMIKRPVLVKASGESLVGFKPEAYRAFLG
ncbi:ArsC family reductase [Gellertiella hungarica]|uniref:Arsenate reductase n=1 Tax=Gellertiella hungarica TaxID=1572859 RepID=A0A7W6J6P3_9HYPH|nr:ArsC family reductase [Gellertiella hungarica]MBB4065805.1 arsenate reductase [Gellertiella hungarica]